MIKELLTSKRTWVVIVAAGAYLAAKFGFTLDDATQQALVESIIVVVGGVGTIVTKILDSKN